VRCVGSRILPLNSASGIAAPTPFRSKSASPPNDGVGKDYNYIYFNPTTRQCHLDAWSFSFIGVCNARVLRCRGRNLRQRRPSRKVRDIPSLTDRHSLSHLVHQRLFRPWSASSPCIPGGGCRGNPCVSETPLTFAMWPSTRTSYKGLIQPLVHHTRSDGPFLFRLEVTEKDCLVVPQPCEPARQDP
jgi:hypothetical protein